MRRLLKFRIWDRTDKKFIIHDNEGPNNYILNLNGDMYNLLDGSSGYNYVIQQWTGLTDDSGIDVYDGDIITYSFPNDDTTYTDTIVWYDYGWSLLSVGGSQYRLYQVPNMKVVGNIFELVHSFEGAMLND